MVRIPVNAVAIIHNFLNGEFLHDFFSGSKLPAVKMFYSSVFAPLSHIFCCMTCRSIVMTLRAFIRSNSLLPLVGGGMVPILIIM